VFVILVVILIIFLTRKRTTPMAAEPTHPEPLRPSEEEEKVFCTNCGKQIPPEATFCPYCGHQCP
jgi:predicted amidophosphoribosyltransferase